MAIVKMKRMTLLAMKCDKDKIFDALIKSNVVQLKRTEEISRCTTEISEETVQRFSEKARRAEEAMDYLKDFAAYFNVVNKASDVKAEIPKSSFARPLMELDFDFFLNFGSKQTEIEEKLEQLRQAREKVVETENLLKQNATETQKFALYENLPHPTTWYADTDSTLVRLAQLPSSEWNEFATFAEDFPLVEVQKLIETPQTTVVAVVAHKSQTEFFEKGSAFGLVKCDVVCDVLPKTVLQNLRNERKNLEEKLLEAQKQVISFCELVPQWKIYVDWMNLCVKKAEADGDLQKTAQTFVLEGFYPAEEEQTVQQAVEEISDCLIASFYEIGDEEFAPTLTKNNKVVSKFECITNAYTPPSYHDIDPNPAMTVCYFVLFGFMVADIGYGLLLVLAGLAAHLVIKQQTGVKTLLQVFGICGISAIAVGALFGSFFSYSLYQGIIPDPSKYPMLTIILSIFLGICHIMVGVGCNMATKYKHGQKLSAWLADFPWLFVFVGLVVAIWNSAVDMASYEPYQVLKLPQTVSNVGLYVCLAALAVGVVFAGVDVQGVKGKVTKSFGTLYGLINYFSDAMSYIRVFGLMLSSALIGQVVNMLAGMVTGSGGIGYVFAAIILIAFHLFNLVMGILSVYIHNGRLQYVEFFGKFYEGDGQLFVPFGSDTKYTLLQKQQKSRKNTALPCKNIQ